MPSVLAHRSFRRLFASQALSTVGDRMVIVVLALYVTDVGTASDLGLVLAAQTVPLVVLLLFGGVWADRLPRQRVMVATDLVRAALHALLAVLILTGRPEIWVIVVIEALFAAASAFFRPAYSGLVPQTVPEDEIQAAQALNAAVMPMANLAGPAVGTALYFAAGAGWTFAIDAATFLVSAALLIGISARRRGEAVARTTMLAELRAGWREVAARPWVWATIGGAALILMTSYAPYYTLGPDIARSEHGSGAVFGITAAVMGVGELFGSRIAMRVRPRRLIAAANLATLPWALNFLLFALGVPLPILYANSFVAGVGIVLFMVWWETALTENIPPHAISRVSSYDWMGSLALAPVGYLLAGPLAAELGGVEVLAGGAVLSIVITFAVLLVRGVWAQNLATPASGLDASA